MFATRRTPRGEAQRLEGDTLSPGRPAMRRRIARRQQRGYRGPTNAAGLDIIKTFEGFSATVYRDPIGIPTIGYGAIRDAAGARLTMAHPPIGEREAEALLRRDIGRAEGAVRRHITLPLTADEFSALVSFTYNLGGGNLQRSTLRMKLNRGDVLGAAREFPKWRRAGGRVLRGLVRRRAAERALFLGRSSGASSQSILAG